MPKGDPPPYQPPLIWSAKGTTEVRLESKNVDATWLGKLVLAKLQFGQPVIIGIEEKK